jgi:hypothetical protein
MLNSKYITFVASMNLDVSWSRLNLHDPATENCRRSEGSGGRQSAHTGEPALKHH